jgi:hypothetical protein
MVGRIGNTTKEKKLYLVRNNRLHEKEKAKFKDQALTGYDYLNISFDQIIHAELLEKVAPPKGKQQRALYQQHMAAYKNMVECAHFIWPKVSMKDVGDKINLKYDGT